MSQRRRRRRRKRRKRKRRRKGRRKKNPKEPHSCENKINLTLKGFREIDQSSI